MQQSMSLEYEPASDPLHVSVQQLLLSLTHRSLKCQPAWLICGVRGAGLRMERVSTRTWLSQLGTIGSRTS